MVTIREAGVERRVTATEAFLLHLSKRGLQGDGTRATLALIEQAKESFNTALPYQADHPHDCGNWKRHICTDGAASVDGRPNASRRRLTEVFPRS